MVINYHTLNPPDKSTWATFYSLLHLEAQRIRTLIENSDCVDRKTDAGQVGSQDPTPVSETLADEPEKEDSTPDEQ